MTQQEMVLAHLAEFGKITSWDAFMDYGITRLSAIIFNLRKQGYTINSVETSAINRFNKKVSFSTYKLEF